MTREHDYRPCQCMFYSFPHRPRSGFCILNPNITEADLENRRHYS